tara:strand:+ start:2127 stop:2888 length:762 start_codon:yes stop_codon:yes gene_type:complete
MGAASRTAQVADGGILERQVDRYYLEERFLQTPLANADVLITASAPTLAQSALRLRANRDFEVTGTNSDEADITQDVTGGIKMETDGADGDEIIVHPHLDTTQTAWETVQWSTDKEVSWGCILTTGASIANTIIWAGLKLTSTEVTATDADQCFFRYEDDVISGNWQCIASDADTDDANDSTIAVAVSTQYKLEFKVDGDRVPRFFINGVMRSENAALKTGITALIPYVGVAADGAAAAKNIILRREWISKEY